MSLRDILKEIQTEKTLKLLLGNEFESATDDHKSYLVGLVWQQIDIDVDTLLNNYILTYQASTPEAKKNTALIYVHTVGTVILTIAISYAVNKEAWDFIWFLGLIMVLIQFLPFIYSKN